MDILLSPPLALLLYIPLVMVIIWFGHQLAGAASNDPLKSRTYSSGEEAPDYHAAPGYRPFLLAALFFAILHLGMLVLGTAEAQWMPIAFIIGLGLALLALILG